MIKHLIMGTAGHVDHGKTALIAALTGIDCDTHKEEKARGITINLGFAHFDPGENISIGIIDVPGHKDFIKTMVAGAYGIDFVLLVIAADSGIMPQTREHFNILQMLGIRQGLVALTKVDIVDEEMAELAKLEILEYLEKTSLKDAPIVPVSAVTGEGIEELKKEIIKIAKQSPAKKAGNVFRMYIDRHFNVKGHGLVVTGSVLNGRVSVGNELHLFPGKGEKVKVRSIQRHGKPVDHVMAGDRAALNISGMKQADFEHGMLLMSHEMPPVEMVDAQIELFDTHAALGTWSYVLFHTGTFYCKARLHLLDKEVLKGNEKGIVQIHLEKPTILMVKDKFIIRNSSNDQTLGGGTVIDNKPLHHKRRTEKLTRNLQQLVDAMFSGENIGGLIRFELEKINAPVPVAYFQDKTELPVEEIEDLISKDAPEGIEMINLSGKHYLITDNYRQHLSERIKTILNEWHKDNLLEPRGLDLKELAGKTGFSSGIELQFLENHLEYMVEKAELKKVGSTWALAGHTVKIDRRTGEQLQWLERTVENFGIQRTAFGELEERAVSEKINKNKLKMLLNYLSQEGKIFFNGEDFIHSAVLDSVRNKLLRELAGKPRGINEKEFRLLIGTSKKTVQLLIGIFIQEGVIEKRTFYIYITDKGRSLIN